MLGARKWDFLVLCRGTAWGLKCDGAHWLVLRTKVWNPNHT